MYRSIFTRKFTSNRIKQCWNKTKCCLRNGLKHWKTGKTEWLKEWLESSVSQWHMARKEKETKKAIARGCRGLGTYLEAWWGLWEEIWTWGWEIWNWGNAEEPLFLQAYVCKCMDGKHWLNLQLACLWRIIMRSY